MATARHSPPGDSSFRASLLRNLGGGVVLVVAVAAVFWLIGMLGRADEDGDLAPTDPTANEAPSEDDVVAEAPTDAEPADPDSEPPADVDAGGLDPDGQNGDSDQDDGGAEDVESVAPEDGVNDPPDGEAVPDGDEAVDGNGEPDAQPDDETNDETDPDTEPTQSVDPSTIALQVLDGYQADGGTAASGVTDELSELGYEVVAENPALRYETTTVLFTEGNEAAGRQVAADLGVSEVRQQPGNLSSQVDVHVVVGADRG